MRTILLPLLALAALTGGAFAQPRPTIPPGLPAAAAPPAPGNDAGSPPPPPPPDAGAPPAPGDQADAPPPPPPPSQESPRGHRPPPPPPSRAAHFHLGRGDTVVDVKCAEDEPMKACADITLQLLDHLQASKN